MDGIKDYNSLVFRTIPGITGIILVIILSLMFLTAFEFVRRRNFELFSYIHSLYFIFIIVLYIHGCGYWLNNDQVYELAYVTPFLILSFLHVVKKHIQKYSHSPIIDVSFSAQNSVAYIKILKPKYFNITPGEYLFLAVPTISYYQWHPFSIASVGEDGKLNI